jgi:hypothetical protein
MIFFLAYIEGAHTLLPSHLNPIFLPSRFLSGSFARKSLERSGSCRVEIWRGDGKPFRFQMPSRPGDFHPEPLTEQAFLTDPVGSSCPNL